MTMRVVIRADAGNVPEIGTGHIARATTLAKALVVSPSFHSAEVVFATRSAPPYELGARLVRQAGYSLDHDRELAPNSGFELANLLALQPDMVILDRLETTADLVSSLRRAGIFVVTFDDLGSGRAHANLAIHPLLQAVAPASNIVVGYQYLFPLVAEEQSSETRVLVDRVFVSFGGFDGRRLSRYFLELIPKINGPRRYDVVVGELPDQEINELSALAKVVANMAGVAIAVYRRPADFFSRLAASDLAIVAGGLTAFECARVGVPSIGIPQYEHQIENLDRLESHGCLKCGSHGMTLDAEFLCGLVTALAADHAKRCAMSLAGKATIDGQGLERTVALITKEYRNFRGGAA